MRRTKDLAVRLILALVLLVAALPLRAGATVCAHLRPPKIERGKAECAMPCCEKRPVAAECPRARVGCGNEGQGQISSQVSHAGTRASRGYGELRTRRDQSCGCALRQAHSVPPLAPKAILPSFDASAFAAFLPGTPTVPVQALRTVEPGILGLDSGPPPGPPDTAHASRAPPVRA